ncbi:MAG: hypothetical protein K2W92_02430 [Alphaproteobacteria bacterium]|nr:hypothetical protein [Burkholderiaceae bacterium]MBY0292127.1 hypothetical protein [Alphaproteobacteria bacterium]
MPFTPFHFGLGTLAKAVAPKHVSFAGFALSQILMDVEPGYKMLTNSASDLHIITHNMPGASLIAAITYGVWRGWEQCRPTRYKQALISKSVLAGSCIFGSFSHVFLDGMYHVNMGLPQAQWAIARASFGTLSGTEGLCVGFLIAGAVIALARLAFKRRKADS